MADAAGVTLAGVGLGLRSAITRRNGERTGRLDCSRNASSWCDPARHRLLSTSWRKSFVRSVTGSKEPLPSQDQQPGGDPGAVLHEGTFDCGIEPQRTGPSDPPKPRANRNHSGMIATSRPPDARRFRPIQVAREPVRLSCPCSMPCEWEGSSTRRLG